ncbi:MAG: class I SAM-dependent methyltransferase [Deltaproteobacteria bacterium]|nr:class I SAM-dependent methyltransferase [Deltaproteobacteria bacterium]MBW1952361.1 class I SAM-dependent methyltransferase [Deltaproteobacteria bacterium]MBW1986473.1 class I SAM-dependent methyltransferase [Deltaproteobacteria bacterium]MBW2135447.1 class I SAM-dependent methyltransferase [Deltaproteobacteria bacterium]
MMVTDKSLAQKFFDLAFAPLRLTVLPDKVTERLGLTSLWGERLRAVLPWVQGRLLDIGCGDNQLVHTYGNGIGVDVYDWGGGALILPDCSRLPFADGEFDTVTIIAALNHIPNRQEVLVEARRVLAPEGRLLITMIDPVLSYLGHRFIWWYSEDKERGMEPGEVYGFWNQELISLVQGAGYQLRSHQRFLYGLNNLFIFVKV